MEEVVDDQYLLEIISDILNAICRNIEIYNSSMGDVIASFESVDINETYRSIVYVSFILIF
jgi:hypothetical protein